MTSFENFYNELLELVSKYEKNNIALKIEKDLETNIIKIFGENMSSLSRAKHGINDVSELAFATAEHHPLWNLLYNCSDISSTLLEKWEDDLSKKDFEDIEWAIKEFTQTLQNLKGKSTGASRQR